MLFEQLPQICLSRGRIHDVVAADAVDPTSGNRYAKGSEEISCVRRGVTKRDVAARANRASAGLRKDQAYFLIGDQSYASTPTTASPKNGAKQLSSERA